MPKSLPEILSHMQTRIAELDRQRMVNAPDQGEDHPTAQAASRGEGDA